MSVSYQYATIDPALSGVDCFGSDTRTFTLAPYGASWRVLSMTGVGVP